MSHPFEPESRYAALSITDWWVIWVALQSQDDARNQNAHNVLGSLVMADWLDDNPVEPDHAGRSPNRIEAMRTARDHYQDRWIDERCELGIRSLGQLRQAEHPYRHRELDRTARSCCSSRMTASS